MRLLPLTPRCVNQDLVWAEGWQSSWSPGREGSAGWGWMCQEARGMGMGGMWHLGRAVDC